MPPVHVDKDHGVDGVLSSYNSIIYLFIYYRSNETDFKYVADLSSPSSFFYLISLN